MKVMEEWIEQGRKPTRIIASHLTGGQVDKTRPLCPFGQVAKYKGTGDTNDAANFLCAAEAMGPVNRQPESAIQISSASAISRSDSS
jgi:hypothetical protein